MKYIFFLVIICFTLSCKCYAQVSVDSCLAHFARQWNDFPIESLYLQTSKDIYETGEDLWFKGYQLDAQTFGLSDKSKTLYLQMVNSEDSVVWQEKYPIENGIVSGHVYIDEKLSEGDYFLEGYTKYSFYKNDTIGMTPHRKIKIVKSISRSRMTELLKDTTFRFEVFPEGGNLVSGLPSNLAFKATDGRGNPVFVEGTIYQDDKPLRAIKSVHDGMGAVLFIPYKDKRYRIELNNGKSYLLPDIHSQGMVLRLSGRDKKQLDFVVSQSDSLLNGPIYLMGQMRGMICCVAKGILRDSLRISIPLDNFFYQGIAEFTLFDSSMRPVAERLVYVHPEKKLYIVAEPDKKSYFIRKKGTIKIKVTDEAGKPVRANLGVSVFDQAYDNPAAPMNILSYCYLSSQIRGKIYNPTYYFDERNNGRKEGMDLLLLTQGWRRYIWDAEDWHYEGLPFLSDEINGMQILRSKSKKKNEQNQGTEQLLQISGADGNSRFLWTDTTGHFVVDTEIMNALRGGYVYLKPMLSKEFKPALELTDYFPLIDSLKRYRSNYYPAADLSQYNKQQVIDLPVVSGDSTILLNEVTVTAKGHKPFRDKMMGRLDSLAQMNLNNIWVCGSCGLLLNYKAGYDGHHSVNNCPAKNMNRPIDGHAYKIAKYEHFESTSYGVPFRVIDIQDIVYHTPQYSEEELLKINNLWRTKGYYTSREFYQPDQIEIQSSIPDARNTLLWTLSVITDEKGEAEVSFYCSDINTVFVGVVEGVDGTGLLGNANCEFRVMRK
uniref:hypothetical protein n=1 Tax=uncultured Bacteroides sp. TaxID=162156 RepID=UPI0025D848F0|nr:hypothetical protein [uncultured Bacteroides sp.]